jgi:omega-6 fatty acid desaturase (delta-12 desaturase)
MTFINWIIWTIYAFVQGTTVFGLWVIGHECGHGAFCNSPFVNDLVGYVIHTALLVPYFSWKRTHAVHHARCNHLLDGETHVPGIKKKLYKTYDKIINMIGEDSFIIFQIVNHLLFGWIMYLTSHETGSRRSPVTHTRYTKRPNHFDFRTSNELFPEKYRVKIAISTFGIVTMILLLSYAAFVYSLKTVLIFYGYPYLIIRIFLITVTMIGLGCVVLYRRLIIHIQES